MLGRSIAALISTFEELDRMPAHQAMQRVVYWGVIVMSVLLVVLCTTLQSKVSHAVKADIESLLLDHTWAVPLTSVDGQTVILRGTIEPERNLGQLVQEMQSLPSVRLVTRHIEQKPRPSAELQISRTEGKVSLEGRLAGNDLDLVVQAVKRAFPKAGIRDRIRIDDRLGTPFWIAAAQPALETLTVLNSFTLYGWRDVLMVTGVASNSAVKDRLRYALSARLGEQVKINYQVRVVEEQDSASISLVAGWNGASLRGQIPDPKTGKQLLRGLVALADVDEEDAVTSDLQYNTALSSPRLIRGVAKVLPALSKVHDLRLETSGNGLILWGRVDSSEQLGEVIIAIERAELASLVDNQLFVDPATRKPELSLFRDSTRAIVSGRMPGIRARANLISTLKEQLGVTELESFISVEPNVAFSEWLDKWAVLTPAIPDSAFGLTVAENAVMVSGDTKSRASHLAVANSLNTMFPDMRIIDWMTVGSE